MLFQSSSWMTKHQQSPALWAQTSRKGSEATCVSAGINIGRTRLSRFPPFSWTVEIQCPLGTREAERRVVPPVAQQYKTSFPETSPWERLACVKKDLASTPKVARILDPSKCSLWSPAFEGFRYYWRPSDSPDPDWQNLKVLTVWTNLCGGWGEPRRGQETFLTSDSKKQQYREGKHRSPESDSRFAPPAD